MQIDRKQFLGITLGTGAAWALQACGGGGYSGGSTPTSSCSAAIGTNHGHTLTITVTDLESAADKIYDIAGSADHTHSVSLTLSQLSSLKSGISVSVTSTPGGVDNHSHVVNASCTIY